MIGVLACLAAFLSCWRLSRRSLGDGLGIALAWGYSFGILRANYLDGATHFVFDAASVGVYVGAFSRPNPGGDALARKWLIPLMGWPVLVMLVPYQHPLVQLVGLRAAIFFLPFLLLGARASESDLHRLAWWAAMLNVIALGVAGLEYVLGVPRFFPYNAVTDIIYRSGDVGADRHLRIPSTFSSAHAYGGTMVMTLPLLIPGLLRARRGLELAVFAGGVFAAALGVFLCAARQPAIYLFALGAYVWVEVPLSLSRRIMAALLVAVIGVVVLSTERLQRFSTLSDTERVVTRLEASANLSFLELVVEHPMGEGLASAAGTSIPYFLSDLAKPQIGMENEWGRIALEQSLVGLVMWLAFVGATLARVSRGPGSLAVTRRLIWAYVGMAWATAFVGTGMLTAIPGTCLMLFFMGALWRVSPRATPGAPRVRAAAPVAAARTGAERAR